MYIFKAHYITYCVVKNYVLKFVLCCNWIIQIVRCWAVEMLVIYSGFFLTHALLVMFSQVLLA